MTYEAINGFLDGLRPPRRLDPAEWADTHRYLSSVAAAEPGRWRTTRTPYLREIMNRFDPYDKTEEVIFMKGAQIGASETAFNVLGYFVDMDPCPIMYVMPTESTAKRNSKMRLDPMIEASPTLKSKIADIKSRDKGNTILQKDFPGGTLILAGANSASGLRSVPVRVLLLDEVDAFPQDLDGEGSPVDLAKARTRTFANKKIFQLSTPTMEATSRIALEFSQTDQRFYFVPCPHCGHTQRLTWDRVKFNKADDPVTDATYQCEGCEEHIEERHKPGMLARGVWTPTADVDQHTRKVGYHLSSLYSPLGWYSWSDAANDFLKAKRKNDQNGLKVFVNTVLGETWKEKIIVPEYDRLFERRGGYRSGEVPPGVAILTAGVDVQDDRLELEVVGWGEGLRSWSIDYRVLPGKTSEAQVWADLREVLNETFARTDGARLGIYRAAIDSGYNTNHVYKFCRSVGATRAVPIKGQSGSTQSTMLRPPQSVSITADGKRTGTTMLWNIGVDILKTEIYGALNLALGPDGDEPAMYCRFPSDYDISYFKMLTAERLVARKNPRGFTAYSWEKQQERNEALDCRAYARAAAAIVGVDRWEPANWKAAAAAVFIPPDVRERRADAAPAKKQRRQSDFW
jgi:phage terminase large subunit GpA-like protein